MNYGTLIAVVFVVSVAAYFITLHLVHLTLSDGWLWIWKGTWLAYLIGIFVIVIENLPPPESATKTILVLMVIGSIVVHLGILISHEQETVYGVDQT